MALILNRKLILTLRLLGVVLVLAALLRVWMQLTPHGLREGDIIFQTSLSPQSAAIQAATHSAYSHMGVLMRTPHGLKVFEAAKTVRLTRFDRWVRRGQGWHYTVMRLKDAKRILSPENLERLRGVAETLEGKPYDPSFEWSDERIYCSELVWKMFQRGLGLEIGTLTALKYLDRTDPLVKTALDQRFHGRIPLYETVISPQAMAESDLLVTVRDY